MNTRRSRSRDRCPAPELRTEDAIHPRDVKSPARNINSVGRIYIEPVAQHWSVAEIDWTDDDGHRDPHAIGCRWNGNINDADQKGHPTGHSHPVWFILPEPFASLGRALIEAATPSASQTGFE